MERCARALPGLGEKLGDNGKAICSFARQRGSDPADRRGGHDAEWGVHEHHHSGEDGTKTTVVKKWFGFTLHLLADTTHELPVNFAVTPVSRDEMPVIHELIEETGETHPELMEQAQEFTRNAAIEGFRPGSLVARYRKCGKPTCHCTRESDPGHGPSWPLTRAVKGRR